MTEFHAKTPRREACVMSVGTFRAAGAINSMALRADKNALAPWRLGVKPSILALFAASREPPSKEPI
jgi:hypothetical protein